MSYQIINQAKVLNIGTQVEYQYNTYHQTQEVPSKDSLNHISEKQFNAIENLSKDLFSLKFHLKSPYQTGDVPHHFALRTIEKSLALSEFEDILVHPLIVSRDFPTYFLPFKHLENPLLPMSIMTKIDALYFEPGPRAFEWGDALSYAKITCEPGTYTPLCIPENAHYKTLRTLSEAIIDLKNEVLKAISV